jgi:uncharacterized glyoxalase superfamily protein PhnB
MEMSNSITPYLFFGNRAFVALSAGGQVAMPLTKTFWSPCFGMVVDRFGVGWMVTIATEPTTVQSGQRRQALSTVHLSEPHD